MRKTSIAALATTALFVSLPGSTGCGSLSEPVERETYTITVRGAGMLEAVTIGVVSNSGRAQEQTLTVDGTAEFSLAHDESVGFELYLLDEDNVPCRFDDTRQVLETASAQVYLLCLLTDFAVDGPGSHQMDFWPEQTVYEISVGQLTESIGVVARTATPDVSARLSGGPGTELIDLVNGQRVAGLPLNSDESVYTLEVEDSASGWSQVYNLLVHRTDELAHAGYIKPGDTEAGARFGYSLALSSTGDRMLVGAPFSAGGKAYLFARDAIGRWRQVRALQPALGDEARFGQSVALSADGRVLAIGAPLADEGEDVPDSGAVYVYTCTESGQCAEPVRLVADNLRAGDWFGYSLALSHAGDELLVGAPQVDDGEPDALPNSGAAYLFRAADGVYTQASYLRASNPDAGDGFGWSVAMNGSGTDLAVGAFYESSGSAGVDGDQSDNSTPGAGAVYTFVQQGQDIVQEHYVKASNPGSGDDFGHSLALSLTGDILVVASNQEDSGATGVNGDQSDNSASRSGAVYVLQRSVDSWVHEAYIKPSNTDPADNFGYAVALSSAGTTLLVGAMGESASDTGVSVASGDNERTDSGALYIYRRDAGAWSEVLYAKGSNTDAGDYLGWSVAISGAGDVYAGGAWGESSAARGVGPRPESGPDAPDAIDESDNSAQWAGAVHVFE